MRRAAKQGREDADAAKRAERAAAQPARRATAAGAAKKSAAAKVARAAEETRAAEEEHPAGMMPGERGAFPVSGGGTGRGAALPNAGPPTAIGTSVVGLRAPGTAVAGALCGVREVVLGAVQQSGRALAHASVELRGDLGAVLAAVEQSELALQFATVALRADWVVVLAAVLQDGGAFDFVWGALQAETPGLRWPRGNRTSMGPISLPWSSGRTRALRLRPCGVTGLRSGSFRGRFAGTGAWCWRRCGGPGPLSSLLRKRSRETGRWYLRRCSKTVALYRSLRRRPRQIGIWF